MSVSPSPHARAASAARGIDSPYAWFRLAVAIVLSTLGGVGMWSVVVVLPAVQADFHLDRGAASLPFTLTMIGFGIGGVVMGRLADRCGVMLPVLIGAASLALGYAIAAVAPGLPVFTAAYVLIGTFGVAATFAPLLADTSLWFERHRGIAVALCASGNYVSGAIWPTVTESLVRSHGWRATHLGIALLLAVAMPPLALLLRGRPPLRTATEPTAALSRPPVELAPGVLQTLLGLAGLACCVAMAMPQVHIVAYCSDLGYGAARGAQMLSLMLGLGILSRIGSGFLADRWGGVITLAIGSAAQMAALMLYLLADSLTALYVISGLFGLFQGGLVPSYAIIIRENFPMHQAGTRLGLVMMMTLLGMALGGFLSGVIFDLTGSYRFAFANGVAWNAANLLIALYLLARSPVRAASLAPDARPGGNRQTPKWL